MSIIPQAQGGEASPGSAPSPVSPSPSPPPQRTRKTHLSDDVSAALRALPSNIKRQMNRDKTGRNAQRALQHAQHLADPIRFPTDASATSSLITILEEDPFTPSPSFLARFSPAAAHKFSSFFSKRKRDDDFESPLSKPAKRQHRTLVAETNLDPGAPEPIGFHQYLFDLDRFKIYIPLSLFTNANLRTLNREAGSVSLKKINPLESRAKPPQVLDTDAFQKRHSKEEDLVFHLWQEAARNFLRFAAETGVGGAEGPWYLRWDKHFGFFEQREDAFEFFPAILALDIKMRKDYNTSPFAFDASHYAREYEKAKVDLRFRSTVKPPSRWGSTISSISSSVSPTGFNLRSGTGKLMSSFRKGSGGDASSSSCLLCARRGHLFSTCTATTLEDGRPLFASILEGNLVSAKGGDSLCRIWNIKGDGSCTHGDTRVHRCSFCGDKKHFAFSWSCRKEPPKKA